MTRRQSARTAVLARLAKISAWLAAACLAALFLTVVLQILTRWASVTFPGSTEYAGYFMAASTFFALAAALYNDVHIRITVVLARLGRLRRAAEILGNAIAAAVGAFIAYHACQMVRWSWILGDVSQGQDATPLWVPQLAMAAGALLFAAALAERFVHSLLCALPVRRDKAPMALESS